MEAPYYPSSYPPSSRDAIGGFPNCTMACFLGVRTHDKKKYRRNYWSGQSVDYCCQYILLCQCPALLIVTTVLVRKRKKNFLEREKKSSWTGKKNLFGPGKKIFLDRKKKTKVYCSSLSTVHEQCECSAVTSTPGGGKCCLRPPVSCDTDFFIVGGSTYSLLYHPPTMQSMLLAICSRRRYCDHRLVSLD